MRATDLNWRTTEHTGRREQRTGNVLFYAMFGEHSRFCIEELYQSSKGTRLAPTLYVLRDADRPLEGGRSVIVARSDSAQRLLDHALALATAKTA